MKALVLREYMKLVYEDVPRPEVAPDEVLVKVEACGICGSDVHGMDGSTGRRRPPLIMGHEASGVVAEMGPAVAGLGRGRPSHLRLDDLPPRRLVLPARALQPQRRPDGPRRLARRVPAGRGLRRVRGGASAHPLPGAGARELRAGGDGRAGGGGRARRGLTRVAVGDTAVVVGAGMIGLCLVQVLRAAGCARIFAVDLEADKLELARKLGADVALDPQKSGRRGEVAQATEGRGADVAFEAVGITASVKTAIAPCAGAGRSRSSATCRPRSRCPCRRWSRGSCACRAAARSPASTRPRSR